MNKQLLSLLALVAVLWLAACAPVTTPPTATAPEPTTAAAPSPAAVEQPGATSDARPAVPLPPADGSRPLANIPATERNDRFSGPAPTYIKPDTIYVATFVTEKGNIVAELYPDTPQSANNFVTLALNGFYDGLTFHRVEPGFVIQGGDPTGDGMGGPGYTIPAEIKHGHPRGVLAWARTGDQVNPERRSSGSQFYITIGDASFLDGAYTVFGYVIEGMDVADQISVGDKILRVEISEATISRLPTPTPIPEPKAPVAADGRPLAALPVAEREGLYNTPPTMALDTSKTYQATIITDKGEIVVDLDPVNAPQTVNNFILLVNLGYYDGMPVAYVEPEVYMITGSPASMPSSDVGYRLPLEPQANAGAIVTGTVSLYPVVDVTGEVAASGSQFFISFMALEDNTTPLNIFGQVTGGMEVAQQLVAGDVIKRITIHVK
ncbi:MAG: peptidylprolyl isomerase [Anaerolineae bacterium]